MGKVEKFAVIGLGYVGLPLALQGEQKDFSVIGVDLNEARITQLQNGISPIDEEHLNKLVSESSIQFTTSFQDIEDADAVIICVPTPVHENKEPDLEPLIHAVKSTLSHMREGVLLVIESTINPGVCDEVIVPLIEKNSDFIVGKTLHLAHCPERINPGDPKWHVGNINRVLGADTKQGLELALNLYTRLIDAKIKPMASLKEAEAVKIVENSFRDINIAFVNELAMSFNILGISVNNVIEGAATKPFAFIPHYPGMGVGGHCIPVDPYYLIQHARHKGFEHKFLSLARSINESMPVYSVSLLEKAFTEKTGQTLADATVAVLGLSYKANVGDDRESPAYPAIQELERRGATVVSYDPFIPEKSNCKTLVEAVQQADAILLATAHESFLSIDPKNLSNIKIFLDGRNALQAKKAAFESAGIEYLGIGL